MCIKLYAHNYQHVPIQIIYKELLYFTILVTYIKTIHVYQWAQDLALHPYLRATLISVQVLYLLVTLSIQQQPIFVHFVNLLSLCLIYYYTIIDV